MFVSSENQIKVGIFGTGYWGRLYSRVLSEIDGLGIEYICDTNPQMEKLVPKSASFYTDPEVALDSGTADAIFIITPAHTHKNIIMNALKRNINTFVEKPVVLTSGDFREILHAKNKDTLLYPGHLYAYNSLAKAFISAIKEIKESIISVQSLRMSFGPVRSDVGCLWDLFPHDLTIFDMLGLGKVDSIFCRGQYPLKKLYEDIANCEIHYSSGIVASVSLNWAFPVKVRQTSVVTEKSIAFFDETNHNSPLSVYKGEKDIATNANMISFNNRITSKDYLKAIEFTRSEPLKDMVLSFISSIKERRFQLANEEILRAKRIISIVESAQVSMRDGGIEKKVML